MKVLHPVLKREIRAAIHHVAPLFDSRHARMDSPGNPDVWRAAHQARDEAQAGGYACISEAQCYALAFLWHAAYHGRFPRLRWRGTQWTLVGWTA